MNAVIFNIDRRDYFITHAPLPVPVWFKPVMLTSCPDAALTKKDFEEHKEKVVQRSKEIEAWIVEYRKQCLLQWPIYWADEMIRQIDENVPPCA